MAAGATAKAGETAVANGVLYVGGSFTKIDGFDHHRIAAIDAATGNVINTWAPDIQDGEVRALAIGLPMKVGDPVNTIYAGGSFTSIGLCFSAPRDAAPSFG